jgi:NADH-quinone oxidoreductase subunit M
MIMLAVPGSAAFTGEFSILAGVFAQGWGYAAVGAAAVVLAAMYGLRLISALLHVTRGSAVPEDSPDLRPGELALVLPLVGILLVLSAWPAAVSGNSFPGDAPAQTIAGTAE